MVIHSHPEVKTAKQPVAKLIIFQHFWQQVEYPYLDAVHKIEMPVPEDDKGKSKGKLSWTKKGNDWRRVFCQNFHWMCLINTFIPIKGVKIRMSS
jgi:hypothetical protein